jgi:hypothetical protein
MSFVRSDAVTGMPGTFVTVPSACVISRSSMLTRNLKTAEWMTSMMSSWSVESFRARAMANDSSACASCCSWNLLRFSSQPRLLHCTLTDDQAVMLLARHRSRTVMVPVMYWRSSV